MVAGALPFSMAPAGAPGCDILTSTDVLLPFVTGPTGALSVTLQVPPSQALIDAKTFHQFFVVDGQANQLGIAVTNGGIATFGF